MIGPDGQAIPAASNGAFPMMVQYLLPPGHARHCRRRAALGVDGIAGRRVQRLLHAVHGGPLREVEPGRDASAQLVRTGRIATGVMVLVALAWIPVIKGAQGLYDYLQAVQGYLAPPIFVVFFFGVFCKRLNARARSGR